MIASLRFRTAASVALALGLAIATALATQTQALSASSKPVVAGLPLAAPARQPVYVTHYSTYTGWATVGYPADGFHTMSTSISAYRWTSNGWVRTSRQLNERVWVAPFATDWSWTWTSSRGWLAMRDVNLIVRWEYLAVAT